MSNSKSEDTPYVYNPNEPYCLIHKHGHWTKDCPDNPEPPQDTSLTEITAEYFMATDPDRVALQRKVLAWHKAERAKLFEQIRSELLDHFTIGAPSYNTANEAVKAQARQKVEGVMEALTRLEKNNE